MDWLAYERLILRKLNLEEEMLKAFRLKSLDELEGGLFPWDGLPARSASQLSLRFAKYITFVKCRVKHDEEA
ncbi:hypothetical protein [Pseudomonas yangonensis]|uniref:hypothetical protein n=1 Tax=Pseudomonas yangonensis TaxID=2579922 RepID=UPI0015B54884|nr:hypothetical protein [Pseudomonas yangonensis]